MRVNSIIRNNSIFRVHFILRLSFTKMRRVPPPLLSTPLFELTRFFNLTPLFEFSSLRVGPQPGEDCFAYARKNAQSDPATLPDPIIRVESIIRVHFIINLSFAERGWLFSSGGSVQDTSTAPHRPHDQSWRHY